MTVTAPKDTSPRTERTRTTENESAPSLISRILGSAMIFRLAFLLTVLLLWVVASTTVLSSVLPTVPDTLGALYELLTGSQFYEQMWLTVRRVLGGFAIAYVTAFLIGTAMGRSRKGESFFELFIVTGMSQPGIFIAMIILIALGLNESSAIIAMGYLAVPMIAVNFWQGTKRLDTDLQEMSQVFGYSRYAQFRHVILPQLAGPAITAARQAFGVCWKYVVMIELLGLSDGVGYQVNRAFQLYDLTAVIAWTIGFMIFVALFEYVVLRPLERRAFLWRERPMGKFGGGKSTVIEEGEQRA
ncbi:ABC transporter permease subunit [Rhodococcus rhodnii]|uniref:ABC transporter, permease component n=2 Tax=Rhodococcus rhodnii TaxID=38312 RepID=R7WLH2_9NOCA|nr:ABC transporter permease subunit [Rhodococcus rhodnii]EOM74824.1 ABC transporter, permease component [Rhodococcus rhodnii LMG 5362]TXG90962.1 ABC transporter permease subunit [Rhodococcus rhodnii]